MMCVLSLYMCGHNQILCSTGNTYVKYGMPISWNRKGIIYRGAKMHLRSTHLYSAVGKSHFSTAGSFTGNLWRDSVLFGPRIKALVAFQRFRNLRVGTTVLNTSDWLTALGVLFQLPCFNLQLHAVNINLCCNPMCTSVSCTFDTVCQIGHAATVR